MNNLSLMIYAAEVVNNIKVPLVITSASMCIGGVIATISGNVGWSYYSWTEEEEKETSETLRKRLGRIGPRFVFTGLFLAFLTAVVPSSNTIYLIAASEAGETVVSSPEAKEMFNDIKTIIKQKLKSEAGEAK